MSGSANAMEPEAGEDTKCLVLIGFPNDSNDISRLDMIWMIGPRWLIGGTFALNLYNNGVILIVLWSTELLSFICIK